jgi:hypothetical protein
MWKKTKNVLDLVKSTGVITLPGLHSKRDILDYIGNEHILEFSKVQKKIKDIGEGDLVVIFENGNKERSLLVRMKKGMRVKEIPLVNIYRKRGYDNGYTQGKDVIQVSLRDEAPPRKYDEVETMWAFTREVEIVREVNSSEALFKKYWKFQGHIFRNRDEDEERFISI